jgi:hypothetical protein
MSDSIRSRIQVFDPTQEYAVIERRLPHWSQPGTICFITWRTWDSIPESVLKTWLATRDDWLARHGIDAKQAHWRARLKSLPPRLVAQFQQLVAMRFVEAFYCDPYQSPLGPQTRFLAGRWVRPSCPVR